MWRLVDAWHYMGLQYTWVHHVRGKEAASLLTAAKRKAFQRLPRWCWNIHPSQPPSIVPQAILTLQGCFHLVPWSKASYSADDDLLLLAVVLAQLNQPIAPSLDPWHHIAIATTAVTCRRCRVASQPSLEHTPHQVHLQVWIIHPALVYAPCIAKACAFKA